MKISYFCLHIANSQYKNTNKPYKVNKCQTYPVFIEKIPKIVFADYMCLAHGFEYKLLLCVSFVEMTESPLKFETQLSTVGVR